MSTVYIFLETGEVFIFPNTMKGYSSELYREQIGTLIYTVLWDRYKHNQFISCSSWEVQPNPLRHSTGEGPPVDWALVQCWSASFRQGQESLLGRQGLGPVPAGIGPRENQSVNLCVSTHW